MLTDEAMDDLRWKSELIGGVVPIRPEELRDLLDEIARLRAENELQATLYCAAIDDLTSQNDKLRAENERLKAARLRPETVREVLTMERIEREVSAWKRNGEPEGIVGKAHYLELCRLALLGLERDERLEALGRAIVEAAQHFPDADDIALSEDVAIWEDDCHGGGPRTVLVMDDYQHALLADISEAVATYREGMAGDAPQRDDRAERIGRAVLSLEGDETPRDLRSRAKQAERFGYDSYGGLLRAIADAMEEEA